MSNVIKIPNGQMKSAKEKQFEELGKQYKRTIYSVCYMFSRDNEEINDLFQEILVCLWLIWFLCEIDYRREIAISYVPLAFILILSIILIICNMDRFVKMSDELFAQTLRLNGSTVAMTSDYHRSGAYWTGIAFLALNLFGLFLKLGHLPFGNLTIMVAGVTGLVFVLLTGRHLVRVVPDERLIIRMVEVGCMILVVSLEAKMFRFPLSNLLGLVGLSLFLVAALVFQIRSCRAKTRLEA